MEKLEENNFLLSNKAVEISLMRIKKIYAMAVFYRALQLPQQISKL